MFDQNRQNPKKPTRIRLLKRQEKWVLTAQGWIVAVLCVASLSIFGITRVQPFLAVTSPVNSDVLVVEGWIPDYAIEQALAEFESGSYRQIITTGIPLERGFYLAEYKNYADFAAATLRKLGLEPEKVIPVAALGVTKDRTYASAVALRQWSSKASLKLKSINLYTFDVHARRSWLIFQQALAPEIKVGVIAAKPLNYDPNNWWSYSAGVRKVIDEIVAYTYAKLVSWRT